MKNQGQEHGFVAFIMALVVFVMVFVVMPAEAAECESAHLSACEDLIGAEVTFKHVRKSEFRKVCGLHADACAVLNVTAKQCTIYYYTRFLDSDVVDHELNHCRGWFHLSNDRSTYSQPWVDLHTYMER